MKVFQAMAGPVPPQLPCLFGATVLGILEESSALVLEKTTLWDSLCRDIAPESVSVNNFLVPILQSENHWIARNQALGFYSSTSPFKELRDASRQSIDRFNQTEITLFQRQDVFSLLEALLSKHEGSSSS